jgi:hypothetical protein
MKVDQAVRMPSWLLCLVLMLPGCWWQRDAYTQRMRAQVERFEREAEYNRVLGPAFEGTAEFPMWVRPPQATEYRATPKELEGLCLGLFQGNLGSGPLIELVIMGSMGSESLGEFQQKSFGDLNKAGKGLGSELKRQEPASVSCLHGGQTTFEVFSDGAARQLPTGGPTNYQWVCYFAEEGTQKVMLGFIVPDSDYTAFADPMVKCLESLALSGKVSAARSGVSTTPSAAGTKTPSGSGAGTSGGASNF